MYGPDEPQNETSAVPTRAIPVRAPRRPATKRSRRRPRTRQGEGPGLAQRAPAAETTGLGGGPLARCSHGTGLLKLYSLLHILVVWFVIVDYVYVVIMCELLLFVS
jgi:hypothetical protein